MMYVNVVLLAAGVTGGAVLACAPVLKWAVFPVKIAFRAGVLCERVMWQRGRRR